MKKRGYTKRTFVILDGKDTRVIYPCTVYLLCTVSVFNNVALINFLSIFVAQTCELTYGLWNYMACKCVITAKVADNKTLILLFCIDFWCNIASCNPFASILAVMYALASEFNRSHCCQSFVR